MTSEKKSERIEIRVGFDEKTSFVDACDSQGDTPSGALRRFIKGYVRRAKGDILGEANRRLLRRYGVVAGVGFASLFILGLGISAMHESENARIVEAMADYGPLQSPEATSPVTTDRSDPGPELQANDFVRWDSDGNGILIVGEILPNDNHLHRVLDLDGNGISIDEFWAKGRMIYAVADRIVRNEDSEMPTFNYQYGWLRRDGARTTKLIEFDLSGTVPEISVFDVDEPTVSVKSDRYVAWKKGADTVTLNFSNHDYRPRHSQPE